MIHHIFCFRLTFIILLWLFPLNIWANPHDIHNVSKPRSCQVIPVVLNEALQTCDTLQTRQQRDTTVIRILEDYCFAAHTVALECRYSLVAMMSLAARNATRNLLRSPNILLFRLSLKDIRAFLAEAKKYYEQER